MANKNFETAVVNSLPPAMLNKESMNDPTVQEILRTQLKIQQRLLAQQEEEEEKEKETKLRRLAAQKRDADEQEKKRLQDLKFQKECPHHSRGVSFVRGQRDGNGGYILLCQICRKRYNQLSEVPDHLRVDGEAIGGPNY